MEKTCAIKTNPDLGRFVVAAKPISAGEVLFEELPFVCGPKQDSPIVCLGCYTPLQGIPKGDNSDRCKRCSWPLCSQCENYEVHQDECNLFATNKVLFQNGDGITDHCIQLNCITPLRMLLQKEKNSLRWENEISIMEDHEKERRNSDVWKNDENNIVNYLLNGPCKLKDRFSSDLVQKVIGILEVNAFEARTYAGWTLRCLYPNLAILAHSCVPNTSHSSFPNENFKVVVRATQAVSKNEQLYSCYTHTLEGTSVRQSQLQTGKFFICRCKRCLDPAELNSHFSSFKCTKCDPGLIVSTNPLDDNADWKCTRCEFKTSGANISKAISYMQMEISQAQEMEFGPDRLQHCEQLFKKFRSVLHPYHFIQTGLRQALIEMYGHVEGYEMEELPDILLEHKIELIDDVLKILNIVEPGKTRSRAMYLFELHVPHVHLIKSAFSGESVSSENVKKKIEYVIGILNESIEILEWEDEKSTEGLVCRMAKSAVEQLKSSLSSV